MLLAIHSVALCDRIAGIQERSEEVFGVSQLPVVICGGKRLFFFSCCDCC